MGGRDQIIENHAELASSFLSDSELSGDSLPPTLVINLQRRDDRWHDFRHRAEAAELGNYQRWMACDAHYLGRSSSLDSLYDGWNYDRYKAVMACGISHASLWSYIAQSPHDAVLVLEDDVVFNSDFALNWQQQWQQWQQDPLWSVGYLGGSWDNRLSWQESIKQLTLVACSYVLRRRGAMELLATIRYKGFHTAADRFITEVLHQRRRSAVFAPAPITTHPGYADSDIQDPHPSWL